MKDIIMMMPNYVERIQVYFHELIIRYNHSDFPIAIRNTIETSVYKIEGYITGLTQSAISSITSIFDFFFDFIIGAVLAFYVLKDIKMFKQISISLVPRKSRDWVLDVLRDIDMILSGFIRGQVLIAIILSVITSTGLKIIGMRYFLLLGIIAGFGEIIPYFGPILGIIPAIIAAFIIKPISAFWVIILYFILQQFEGAILSPKIMGSRVGLHPVIVILSVLIGGKFFGIIGLIFAVPIAGIIKVVAKRIIQSIV
jgi:predicted PurR-regulated permease PerM